MLDKRNKTRQSQKINLIDDLTNSKFYEQNSHILIHIIKKETMINGKMFTVTFLKDITFGVLFEQIKAQ